MKGSKQKTIDLSKKNQKKTAARAFNAYAGMVGDFSGAAGCFSGLVIHHVRMRENNNDSLNYLPQTRPHKHAHTHAHIHSPGSSAAVTPSLGQADRRQRWKTTMIQYLVLQV